MEKLRIIVLLVSIMPMILSSIVYLLLKNKRFVRGFFGVETVNQTTWLPWLFWGKMTLVDTKVELKY